MLLALMSIVQAIAIEKWWDGLANTILEFDNSLLDWLHLLMHVNTFLVLIMVWAVYALNLLLISWTPRVIDIVLPFLFIVIEFFMISVTSPDPLFFVLWSISIIAVTNISLSIFKGQRNQAKTTSLDVYKNIKTSKTRTAKKWIVTNLIPIISTAIVLAMVYFQLPPIYFLIYTVIGMQGPVNIWKGFSKDWNYWMNFREEVGLKK